MSYLSHSTMFNITRSATSNNSSSLSSSAASTVGVVPPAVANSVKGAVGAAAFLWVHATQAAAIATAAANDTAAVSSTHNIIIDKHCTMFLQRTFGIKPNGTAVDQALLPDHLKKYKSVKTIDSVWLIEKSKENDGFQVWHRDFWLGHKVMLTIVFNVGAITRN